MAKVESLIELQSRWLERTRLQWPQAIITLGVALVSVILPRIASSNLRALLFVLVCFGAISLIILFRWPTLGLVVIILGGLLVPFSGPSGLNIAEVGIALLLGVWLLQMIVQQRSMHFVSSKTMLPLCLFILSAILSFINGQLPWFPLAQQAPSNTQLGGLAIFVLSASAFLLMANLVRKLRWLETLTWLFVIAGGIYVIVRSLPGGWPIADRLLQTGATAGSMFWTWLIALAFSQGLLNDRLHRGWRLLLLMIVLVALYDAIVQAFDWKSGWVPPLVSLTAILAFRYPRRALLLAPVGFVVFYLVFTESISEEAWSWGTRLDAWQAVLKIVAVSPVLGLGFGNYHWYTPLFPMRGYYNLQFNSHNQYVDIIAQTGLVGLACFFWLVTRVGHLGWRLRTRAPGGFAQAYIYGALGGLVGTLYAGMLVDWVLPFVYNVGQAGFRASVLPWLFLGGLVSLEQIVHSQEESQVAGISLVGGV